MKTVFLRTLEELVDKETALRFAIQRPEAAEGRQRFEVDPASFAAVPRSPFAYWVSERMRRLFKELPALEADGRVARVTNPAGDDTRFFRAWWEPIASRQKESIAWVPLSKGGSFAHFYFDVHLVVRWDSSIKSYFGFLGTEHRPLTKPASLEFFFRPGLTWPRRTKSELSFRVMPGGCIFADKGPGIFVDTDDSEALLATLAVGSTKIFRSFVEFQLAAADAKRGGAAHSYEVGVIKRTPMPRLDPADRMILSALARNAWSLKRSLDTQTETSHAFTLPALLLVNGVTLAIRENSWAAHVRATDAEFAAIQSDIEARCLDLYDVDEDDRRTIADGFGVGNGDACEPVDADADDEADDDGDVESSVNAVTLAADLVSWATAVAFGRFDVRLATGARVAPREPEPFAPLPISSLAMLSGDDGLPVTGAPTDYPIRFPENGLLVDDPGHPQDLTTAVRAVFDVVFGGSADVWWDEVGAMLDPHGHDLRTWLVADYFDHHLKRHSKSRRKAPIIWQLAVPSGRYSVWLYAHRISRDSFIQLQNDIVTPKLVDEERRLASSIQSAGANRASKESKAIETQEAFVGELRDLLDKLKHVAPLWCPTLDDGVVLTMAPLWQLVPQHKSWQKELKSKWDELAAGRYDWAHIAMHLWPERVVPKCAEDRSLAIAHGLEDVFWFEDEDGKWKPHEMPQKSITSLVGERTSTAVKAALKNLLDTPEPASGTKRSRKSKAA